jgi:hypothetical protein
MVSPEYNTFTARYASYRYRALSIVVSHSDLAKNGFYDTCKCVRVCVCVCVCIIIRL